MTKDTDTVNLQAAPVIPTKRRKATTESAQKPADVAEAKPADMTLNSEPKKPKPVADAPAVDEPVVDAPKEFVFIAQRPSITAYASHGEHKRLVKGVPVTSAMVTPCKFVNGVFRTTDPELANALLETSKNTPLFSLAPTEAADRREELAAKARDITGQTHKGASPSSANGADGNVAADLSRVESAQQLLLNKHLGKKLTIDANQHEGLPDGTQTNLL